MMKPSAFALLLSSLAIASPTPAIAEVAHQQQCTLEGLFVNAAGGYVTHFDGQGNWRTYYTVAQARAGGAPAISGTYNISGATLEFHTGSYRCARDVVAYRITTVGENCGAWHLQIVRDECNQLPGSITIDFRRP